MTKLKLKKWIKPRVVITDREAYLKGYNDGYRDGRKTRKDILIDAREIMKPLAERGINK